MKFVLKICLFLSLILKVNSFFQTRNNRFSLVNSKCGDRLESFRGYNNINERKSDYETFRKSLLFKTRDFFKPSQNLLSFPFFSRLFEKKSKVDVLKRFILALWLSFFIFKSTICKVSASISVSDGVTKSPFTPLQGGLLWLLMFTVSAMLHSAESAITKISPWKVKEFAEEEGEGSPFATLSANITRLLSTILLTTTACSIYSTALFVTTLTELFPSMSLGAITAALTAVTLFFGELLPKALAVANSETVARIMVRAMRVLNY
jgi:hypothetical protein